MLRGVDASRVATGDGVGLGFNFDMANVVLADGVVANGHVGFEAKCGATQDSSITVTAAASGQVSVGMSFGAAEHVGAQVRIQYNKGFSLIKDVSYGFDPTVSDGTTRATAQAGVNLGEALMLDGLAGPQLNELVDAKLEGKPVWEKPIWCLKGGIEASVELNVNLGIEDLRFGPEKLFGDEADLLCVANTPPKVEI